MPNELDPELEERFSKTQEFSPPKESAELSLDEIAERSLARDKEMKAAVKQSMESVLGMPVYVDGIKYLGEGRFEIGFSVMKGFKSESRTVIVQEPQKKFD